MYIYIPLSVNKKELSDRCQQVGLLVAGGLGGLKWDQNAGTQTKITPQSLLLPTKLQGAAAGSLCSPFLPWVHLNTNISPAIRTSCERSFEGARVRKNPVIPRSRMEPRRRRKKKALDGTFCCWRTRRGAAAVISSRLPSRDEKRKPLINELQANLNSSSSVSSGNSGLLRGY